jgi:hypothetical protein
VSRPLVLLDDVPTHPVALATSPEFPSRAAASSARAAATPPLSPPLPALLPRAPRIGVFRASTCAPEPEIELAGEPHRRSPSAFAPRRHRYSGACGRSRPSDLDPTLP